MNHTLMSKRTLAVLCIAILSSCAGCGIRQPDGGSASQGFSQNDPAASFPADPLTEKLFDEADMIGDVVEFSSSGCVISPTQYSEDGKTAAGSAPGHDDPEKNVQVLYGADCKFQTAVINPNTGSSTVQDVSVSDVKKQSMVAIQGQVQDERHITASLVTITRFEY